MLIECQCACAIRAWTEPQWVFIASSRHHSSCWDWSAIAFLHLFHSLFSVLVIAGPDARLFCIASSNINQSNDIEKPKSLFLVLMLYASFIFPECNSNYRPILLTLKESTLHGKGHSDDARCHHVKFMDCLFPSHWGHDHVPVCTASHKLANSSKMQRLFTDGLLRASSSRLLLCHKHINA